MSDDKTARARTRTPATGMPAVAAAEPEPARRPIEEWRREKGHDRVMLGLDPGTLWMFNAAVALRDWPIGAEVTEAEYDAAIAAATSMRLG